MVGKYGQVYFASGDQRSISVVCDIGSFQGNLFSKKNEIKWKELEAVTYQGTGNRPVWTQQTHLTVWTWTHKGLQAVVRSQA